MSHSLEVPIRPRGTGRSGLWRAAAVLGALAVVVGWTVWYATTPEDLPVSDRTVRAEGLTGTALYVGMFAAPGSFDRSIRVSEVHVRTRGDTGIEVQPLLCRDGAIGVTTAPDQFCAELVEPAGEELTSGDSIMLEVFAEEVGELSVERLEISFREDLRWGTKPAGNAGATIVVSERPAG